MLKAACDENHTEVRYITLQKKEYIETKTPCKDSLNLFLKR